MTCIRFDSVSTTEKLCMLAKQSRICTYIVLLLLFIIQSDKKLYFKSLHFILLCNASRQIKDVYAFIIERLVVILLFVVISFPLLFCPCFFFLKVRGRLQLSLSVSVLSSFFTFNNFSTLSCFSLQNRRYLTLMNCRHTD